MRSVLAFVLAVLAASAADARPRFEDLPERIQRQLFDLVQECTRLGGRPGDAMATIRRFDFDRDGTDDVVLDENRFACRGLPEGAACSSIGCMTYVTLSDSGRWRPAFDIVGSYCIDETADPPRLVTIQRNYRADGTSSVLNVRYRFAKGMAFQEGRGAC